MKLTLVAKMEDITGIPPLEKRREQKALSQAKRYECTTPSMKTRLLRQTEKINFALETRGLQRNHQEKLPDYVEPPTFNFDTPSWKDHLAKVIVNTTIPQMTTKEEQSDLH